MGSLPAPRPCLAVTYVKCAPFFLQPPQQASSLFDTFTLTGFLHGLKKAIVPSGSKAAAGKDAEQPADQGADSDEETADGPVAASGLCAGAMRHLAAFLSAFGLSQTPEVAELIIETFTDLVKVLTAKTSKAKGGKVSAADGELHEAAYAVLRALSHGRHGPVLATCGAIFQRLLPVMMVPPAGGSAAAARRVAEGRGSSLAIDYVVATYRENGAHAAEAVCALVRALCMRAPDKADLRAAAANSAVELLAALPPGQQLQLATFALRLSLTAKVTHRLVALEVAAALLVTPPPAFAAAGGAAADEAAASAVRELAADGDAQLGPDVAPAPWHAVCLSVLLRRCNDKVAGVRSKAVAALAEVVEIFRSRLAAGSGGSSADQQQQQQAASYSLQKLLAAAQAVDLVFVEVEAPVEAQQQQGGGGVDAMDVDGAPGGAAAGRQAKTPATGGTDATVADDDDDEDSSAEEGDGQRRRKAAPSPPPPPPHGVHVAVVPRSLSPSLQPLLELAHRRLQDDKALVRRCALQLLEALLLLQGAAAAAASSCASSAPSSQHKPLRSGGDFAPTSRDLAAIEAATADSLVSVRKAALSAACRLLLAFPDHAPCCELWVRSGLPLVRDPESSIQEALADQCLSLLVDRLVACGAGNGAGAAAQAAMLVPLLAGVSGLGRAASSCLNRVLALLAGRKQLKSKPAAKGLEALIGHLHCLIAAAGAAPPAAATQTQAQRQQQQQLLRPAVHGAWMFLTEVAALDASAPSWQFLQEWWTKLRAADGATAAADGGSGVGAEEGAQLLWVISHAAARFPESEAAPLAKQLLQALLHFSLAPAPAAAHIAALHKLTASSAAASEWAAQLMQAAHETLGKLVERKSDMTAAASRRASAALFAVGEAALLRTAKAPANLTLLVQALTAQRLLPSAAAAAEQPGLSSQVPGGGVEVPAQVQAQAWTCLGKLCVVDEALAKKCVPLLVQVSRRHLIERPPRLGNNTQSNSKNLFLLRGK